MLTDATIRKINAQIQSELRNADSYVASQEEKLAALERVVKLKEILDPIEVEAPSRKTIIRELASALIEAREETRDRNRPMELWEAIFGMRR